MTPAEDLARPRLPILISEAIPRDTLLILPGLQRRPGETDAEFQARLAAGAVKIRVGKISTADLARPARREERRL